MAESGLLQWTIILVLTALCLSSVVITQVIASYWTAYVAAPKEITTFIDAVDFSIQENESYDRDVGKVQRLEDKLRLGRLLREIQKGGDDLREELNSLIISEGGTTLTTSARLLWASKRTRLEDGVRRLDLLRMRFLVVYMGIITSIADKAPPPPPPMPLARDLEKAPRMAPPPRPLQKARTAPPANRRAPARRLTTQAIGHHETAAPTTKRGFFAVVEELQRSVKMKQRAASIEEAMAMEKTQVET